MRLRSITISGFRGFAGAETIDLDADAVIVSGANGRGKTSMFDAILWVLTGSVQRLQVDASDVVSRYSPSGEARVQLELDDDGAPVTVVRRSDGQSHLSVSSSEETFRGTTAENALIDLLWPEARAASEPNDALTRSLTRAMYLQQDVVRQFIEADDEQARFEIIGELVGVGRVTELQRQLETSRNAWSRATNRLEDELRPLRDQIATLEERLRRLGASDAPSFDQKGYTSWVDEVGRTVRPEALPGASDAVSTDSALAALQVVQRSNDRRLASLQRLRTHLGTPPPEAVDTDALRAQVHASEAIVAEASKQLQGAQEAAAAALRRQTEIRDQAESLRALARLALRHLAERCPICSQEYDEQATRDRLQSLISRADDTDPEEASTGPQSAAAQLEVARRQLAADEAALRAGERAETVRATWDSTLASLASEAGLAPSADLATEVNQARAALQQTNDRLRSLGRTGEQLALQLARMAEQDQRAGIETQLTAHRSDLAGREADRDSRMATGGLANSLLEGLRSASTGIVAEELARIDPLLQRIYASVEPHPSFRVARFLTSISRGHGRVWTTVVDEAADKVEREPSTVLSSSQLNVLAVSTFLALNLAIETLPLQIVVLDDPLQSLDTVNLLGLADLLRRVRVSRQVLVSTHDERLAALLCRKLRPVTPIGRTRVVRFEDWTRDGPLVEQYDIPADSAPLKLVAAG